MIDRNGYVNEVYCTVVEYADKIFVLVNYKFQFAYAFDWLIDFRESVS
jgi:hypothetical protein